MTRRQSEAQKAFTHTFSGIRGLIFDCDGVLLDSRRANITFYNYIRDCLDLPPLRPEQEEYVHMSTFEQALEYMIPEDRRHYVPELLDQVENHLDYYSLLSLEDGLIDMLDWLKVNDIKLGMCTNRIEPMAGLLSRFNLTGYFDPIQTASNSLPKPDPDGLIQVLDKWEIDKTEAVFVGDSKVDEAAARAVGMPFWAFKNDNLDADLHITGFTALHGWMMNYAENNWPELAASVI